MTYFNWKKGEPNNDNGEEDYIVWRMSDNEWNDEQNTWWKQYGVVCQDVGLPGKFHALPSMNF